jgi:hypothetical protein
MDDSRSPTMNPPCARSVKARAEEPRPIFSMMSSSPGPISYGKLCPWRPWRGGGSLSVGGWVQLQRRSCRSVTGPSVWRSSGGRHTGGHKQRLKEHQSAAACGRVAEIGGREGGGASAVAARRSPRAATKGEHRQKKWGRGGISPGVGLLTSPPLAKRLHIFPLRIGYGRPDPILLVADIHAGGRRDGVGFQPSLYISSDSFRCRYGIGLGLLPSESTPPEVVSGLLWWAAVWWLAAEL